ncbi:MAG: peptidoglycan DD-metalloendopeptidase family protein [Bacteroidales bacterium]
MKNKKWSLITILFFLTIFIISFNLYHKNTAHVIADDQTETELPPEPIIETDDYGVESEKYFLDESKVKNGQTLSHILDQYNIDAYTIDGMVKKMQQSDLFDPRHVRSGNSYRAYLYNDTLPEAAFFIYDISALEYLKINLKDSFELSREKKQITKVPRSASGIINSSLWVTLTQNNLNPELAIEMSEILAWEVDFHRIQNGDKFKVFYDENYVGDQSIGIDNIHAIYFMNEGREVYGYHFEKDTVSGFFADDGQNLRKVFLKAPLKFGRISSGYSSSRLHPVLGTRRPHYGTDYAAPTGTPIYAVGDGIVNARAYTSGNGNYIKIRHNSVYETQYLHMSKFAKGVTKGTRVKQGDVIGYVGMTGLATGPHVCFRFWKNGKQVNHRKEEFPSADPLHEDYFAEFFPVRDRWKARLDSLSFEQEQQMIAVNK